MLSKIKELADRLTTMPVALSEVNKLTGIVAEKETIINTLMTEKETLQKQVAASSGFAEIWAQEKDDLTKAHTVALAQFKTDFDGQIAALKKEIEDTKASVKAEVNTKTFNELKAVGVADSAIKEIVKADAKPSGISVTKREFKNPLLAGLQ